MLMYHTYLHLYTFTFIALCVVGCDDPPPPPATSVAPPTSSAPAATTSGTVAEPKIAGIISEKDFQARIDDLWQLPLSPAT